MADRLSPEARSRIMAAIRGKDTAPELAVRRLLHRDGFRFSLHRRNLPGTPDIVLRRFKTVVFVNGCLWHGHFPCARSRPPKSNVRYWRAKIRTNRERDRRKSAELRKRGWKVITVWECEIDRTKVLRARLAGLFDARSGGDSPTILRRAARMADLFSFAVESLWRRTVRPMRRLLRRARKLFTPR